MKHFLFTLILCVFAFLFINPLYTFSKETAKQKPSNHIRKDLNGSFLQKPGDSRIFLIDRGYRRHISNPSVLNYLFKSQEIVKYPDVMQISEGKEIGNDSRLIKCQTSDKIYFLDGGKKRHITSMDVLKKYSFNFDNVLDMDCAAIKAIKNGDPIK